MNVTRLAEEIIAGRRLTSADDFDCLLTADLDELCEGADKIRRAICGDRFELCTIINGRSGRCPEDCKFCAQSAHHSTEISEYGFLDEERILAEFRHNIDQGAHRFAIVTAGRALSGEEFDRALSAYRRLRAEGRGELCASLGLLTDEQFRKLREVGVTRIHANIETSPRNFPNICTTHTFEDKLWCIRRAKANGFDVCSGGIIGMGETWHDRIDMALCLAERGVVSVPINVLTPIKGTPFESLPTLTEPEILRTIAIFRYILPDKYIRFAAGRRYTTDSGRRAFTSGCNSAITGDMLTTSGTGINADVGLLTDLGYKLTY